MSNTTARAGLLEAPESPAAIYPDWPLRSDYAHSRGYLPLHPLAERMPPLPQLRELDEAVEPAAGDDPCVHRQRMVDRVVGRARRSRLDTAGAGWWAASCADEADRAPAGMRPAGELPYRDAEGRQRTLPSPAALRISAAVSRLAAHPVDGAAFFSFAAHSDAVLAYAVNAAACHTPMEALGERAWRRYVLDAAGDEQRARLAVAADLATAFVHHGSAYATRAGLDDAEEVSLAAEEAQARWSVDAEGAWERLPSVSTAHPRRPLLPRGGVACDHLRPEDGVYAAESGVVDEIGDALQGVLLDADSRVEAAAAQIAVEARRVRSLPAWTFDDHRRRLQRLSLLEELACDLASYPQLFCDDADWVAVNSPGQLRLPWGSAGRASSTPFARAL